MERTKEHLLQKKIVIKHRGLKPYARFSERGESAYDFPAAVAQRQKRPCLKAVASVGKSTTCAERVSKGNVSSCSSRDCGMDASEQADTSKFEVVP